MRVSPEQTKNYYPSIVMKKIIRSFVAGALVFGFLAIVHSVAAAPSGGRPAKIIHEYTLPPFSLEYFGYSPEELAIAQANGLTVTDRPAIGSGLQPLHGDRYVSVTDRGPNADRTDGNKAFPLPQFTPTITFFKAVHDEIVIQKVLPIVNDLGQGVTGIPNGPAD